MHKKLIITGVISVFVGIYLVNVLKNTAPQEIENAPDWRTISVAQKEAKKTDKLILVDVYEVGCKYCRTMEREVYPDSTVRAVLDAGYVPAKVDGNSEEFITFKGEQVMAREWVQRYGIFVFPGTLILDADGNEVKQRTGFMSVDELRQFLY